MTPPEPPSSVRGGGCLVAAGLVLGPLAGMAFGQVSAGLVAGGLIGVVAAVLLYLADRR